MRRMPIHIALLCLSLLIPALASCGKKLPVVELTLGREVFKVEVAAGDEERRQGLMHRDGLGEREGMLFVFARDQNVAFWMKDTKIPLSVAYISSDGTIKEIHDLSPGSLAAVESNAAVRYALELNRGAFARLGLSAGQRLDLPTLSARD